MLAPRAWPIVLFLTGVLLVAPVSGADAPDYDLAADLALPWACGEAHRVTWEPEGHWAAGKASGVAYDLSMTAGTQLYAPMSGQAHFLYDERPLDTNYGHYVEIIDPTGKWMVRLAHLDGAQSGERPVQVGEPIALSGSSGVELAHLHLELLVRDGHDWVTPDLDRLERVYGVDRRLWVEGAFITHDGCAADLFLSGDLVVTTASPSVGEHIELVVPLRNSGLTPLAVSAVQVVLIDPAGAAHVVEKTGEWRIEGKSDVAVPLGFHPAEPGHWRWTRVNYSSDAGTYGIEASGGLTVAPSPLHVTHMRSQQPARVRAPTSFTMTLQNRGDQPVCWDQLVGEGSAPGDVAWRAVSDMGDCLGPGSSITVTLRLRRHPTVTGPWTLDRVLARVDGHDVVLGHTGCVMMVRGPHLVVRSARALGGGAVHALFLDVANIGDEVAEPDAVEVWGWRSDQVSAFRVVLSRVPPIYPGEATYLRFDVRDADIDGPCEVVEAGYWEEGEYVPLSLPQPVVFGHQAVQFNGGRRR